MSGAEGQHSVRWLVGAVAIVALAGPLLGLYLLGPDSPGEPPEKSGLSFADRNWDGTVAEVAVDGGTLRVNGEPFPILQCVRYQPTPPGVSIGWGYRWAHFPENWQADLPLLEDLGVNAVAVNVRSAAEPRELAHFMTAAHERDIRTILEVNGPNRQDASRPEVRDGFLQNVTTAVQTYRNHPALLLWQIGNEVDFEYPEDGRVEDWYGLLGQTADLVHALDPHHPVATGSSAGTEPEWFRERSPQVDVFGTNYYGLRGEWFVDWLHDLEAELPNQTLLVTEFGVDAWDGSAGMENESAQASFLADAWTGIVEAREQGVPVLGGCVHEWSDQWWKDGHPDTQRPDFVWTTPGSGALPDDEFNEEYFGLVRVQPDTREKDPRQAYTAMREAWTQRAPS